MKTPRANTTLGDLHRATPWLWLHCEKCQHYAPLACAVPVIRWGAATSSDVPQAQAAKTGIANTTGRLSSLTFKSQLVSVR
jgi:hypothetical protein